jgi:hypothetical protein
MTTQKKVMDVAKPEETKPDIGAKPMIVGHKSVAIDPMMKEKDAKTNPFEVVSDSVNTSDEPAVAPSEKNIPNLKPIAQKSDIEEKATKTEDKSNDDQVDQASEPVTDAVKATNDTAPAQDKKNAQAEKENEENKDAKNAIDPVAAELEKQENLRQLIDSKKYYVSVKQSSGRGMTKIIIAITSIVMLLLAGLYYLIDTKKIDFGFDVPVSLFSSNIETGTDTTMKEATNVTTNEAQNASTTSSQTEKVLASTYYTLDTPGDWTFDRKVTELTQDKTYEMFVDTYTLPSGTKVVIRRDLGGKGGACQPDAGDVPFEAGNACPSFEIISRQNLAITGSAFDYTTEIIKTKYADADSSKIRYGLCIATIDPDWDVKTGIADMGAYSSECHPIYKADDTYAIFSIEGVDNTTEGYFQDNDIKEIEQVIKSFKFK